MPRDGPIIDPYCSYMLRHAQTVRIVKFYTSDGYRPHREPLVMVMVLNMNRRHGETWPPTSRTTASSAFGGLFKFTESIAPPGCHDSTAFSLQVSNHCIAAPILAAQSTCNDCFLTRLPAETSAKTSCIHSASLVAANSPRRLPSA